MSRSASRNGGRPPGLSLVAANELMMKSWAGRSPLRVLTGIGSIVVLVWMGIGSVRQSSGRMPAVVDAARTLELASIGPGRYRWSLRNGRAPLGASLISEQLLVFERSELVQVELRSDLRTGDAVRAGEPLASVRSLLVERRHDELVARRAALVARSRLLMAGERDAEVSAAEERVRLAEAEWQAQRAGLARLRELAAKGLASAADLEAAELEDCVLQQSIEVAQSAVDVAQAPARPEAIAEIEADLVAVDANLAEIQDLRNQETVVSPINGVVEIGGNGTALKVYDLDPVYVSFALPERERGTAFVGATIEFVPAGGSDETIAGEVVTVSETVSVLAGRAVYWVSALVPNPAHRLRPGLSGMVTATSRKPERSMLGRLFPMSEGLR